MPALLRKILIGTASTFLVLFIYTFFDPSLKDFLFAFMLRFYLLALTIVVKFSFEKGIISLATIAWKRIFFVGGLALVKRFWINFFKKNAIKHIVKPLMPHTKQWLAVHFNMFKKQPRWIQFSETTVGVAVISTIGYFFGAVAYLWTLIEKVLTGKLQSFFLSILSAITGALQFIWSKIQPWIDIIIITGFIELIEKIPGIKALFRKTRRVKNAVVETKDKAIRAVVHMPVKKMANVIERHTEAKMKTQE